MIYIIDNPEDLWVLIDNEVFYVDTINKCYRCYSKDLTIKPYIFNLDKLPTIVAFKMVGKVYHLNQELYKNEVITSIEKNQNQLIIKTK